MSFCHEFKMIIRVFLNGSCSQFRETTIGPKTTCNDIILSILKDESKIGSFILTEICMGYERVIDDKEQPFEILQQWGNHADRVQFFLRHKIPNVSFKGQGKIAYTPMKDIAETATVLPNIVFGTEYSFDELVKMAEKQREKLIEHQQVMLDRTLLTSALHQRQKIQKTLATDRNERMSAINECIIEKETKYKKLNSLKNLVKDQTQKNTDHLKELQTMKYKLRKRDEELASVIEKFETLKKQLKESDTECSSHLVTHVNITSAKVENLKELIMKLKHQNYQNADHLRGKQEILVFRQQQVADFIAKVEKYRERLNSMQQKIQQRMNADQQVSVFTSSSKDCKSRGSIVDLLTINDDAKCKTLPRNFKFAAVGLFDKMLDVSCMSPSETNKRMSSQRFLEQNFSLIGRRYLDSTTDIFADTSLHQANRMNVSNKYEAEIAPMTSFVPENSDISAIAPVLHNSGTSSKLISLAASINHDSNHLLMNHFAPQPFKSKYSFAKYCSYPVDSPSSSKVTGLSIGSASIKEKKFDSKEIIISDPPQTSFLQDDRSKSFDEAVLRSTSTSLETKHEETDSIELNLISVTESLQILNMSNPLQHDSKSSILQLVNSKQLAKGISTYMPLPKLEDAVVKEKSKNDEKADKTILSYQYCEEGSVHVMKEAESLWSMQGGLEVANESEREAVHDLPIAAVSNPGATVSIKSTVNDVTSENSFLISVPVGGKDTGFGSFQEKLLHKPNVPRPVRRRMSSGDMSEDYMAIDSYAVDSDSFRRKNCCLTQPFKRQEIKKRTGRPKLIRRVSFEPLALLLDASLEGELDLVEKTALEVPDISMSNDEGITALHNAVCAGHFDIVKFLVQFGCDVNSPDSDGWTPLHCAASCNSLIMTQFLIEHGACLFATTFSDRELASDKCEVDEKGYDTCRQYLIDLQDRMGFINDTVIYAIFDYEAENADELNFSSGDQLLVLRKGDSCEQEWWWCCLGNNEGYVPRNLVGLFPRVVPQTLHKHRHPL